MLGETVEVREVGPRDGLQNEAGSIPTEDKVRMIDMLGRAGVKSIQATAFVSPKAVPQMADAESVMERVARLPGVRYSALVPNVRGAERAIAAGVDAVEMVVSVSESHSLANTRMGTSAALSEAARVAELCRGAKVAAELGFATALGCPFEGLPTLERLKWAVGEAVERCGYSQVALADTVGMADPSFVGRVLGTLMAAFPETSFSLHVHNTRNMGLANVCTALEFGIARFDSSIAGLGGCPFAPGASGNIATEDLVNMLHAMAYQTGVDLDALLGVAAFVRDVVGHEDSGVLKAGPTPARRD